MIVAELGAALSEHEALVRERLYGLVGFEDKPGALNAARWDGGTFVYVPRGVEVDLPVESILYGHRAPPAACSAARWWWSRRAPRPR